MSAPSKTILHFTLGPVQGFIGEARRTRDLWAGSFLLSWLSGHAMAALKKAGGEIVFPEVDGDDLFEAINGNGGEPYIGSLPNRFKADVSKVSGNAGQICKDAIDVKWRKLQEAVYEQFIHGVANDQTKIIWDRQIDNFWEMNWVVGDEVKDDGKWLDQRKNWRTHLASDEEGDLCRLMGRYQEISGFHRIGRENKGNQPAFWHNLREKTYTHPSTKKDRKLGELNLGEDERLCSIALIKRLFLLLDNVKDVIGWQPGGSEVNMINWPSVSYIAAVPWLKEIGTKESLAFGTTVKGNVQLGFKGEIETGLFGLKKGGIFDLDDHLLHDDGIRAWKEVELTNGENSRVALIINGLKSVQQSVDASASEFYAVLLMDGDRIGAKIGIQPQTIKTGLATFTKSVKDYLKPSEGNPSNGVLIYAGGDDVLALVPVDSAIEAATALKERYKKAFEAAIKDHQSEVAQLKDFTLSAAIVYAQYKIPLRAVLKKAWHYLEEVAKDGNGRNSLAIAVMKPGGVAYDWVSCWENAADSPVTKMDEIAKDPFDYSSSFFYNVRARYAPLFEDQETGADKEIESKFANVAFMDAVLTAEYKKQFSKEELKNKDVPSAIKKLMIIGKPLENLANTPTAIKDYSFDGVLVARFISGEMIANKIKTKGKRK